MKVIYLLLVLVSCASVTSSLPNEKPRSTSSDSFCAPAAWQDGEANAQLLWTTRETKNTTAMANIGNGYIATTMFAEYSFIAGVYNGRAAVGNETVTTHRAQLPARHLQIEVESAAYCADALDMQRGLYSRRSVIPGQAAVTMTSYAHASYLNLFVTQLDIQSLQPGGVTVSLKHDYSSTSPDLGNVTVNTDPDTGITVMQASTIEGETASSTTTDIGMAWTNVATSPITVADTTTILVLSSYSSSLSSQNPAQTAVADLTSVLDKSAETLLNQHVIAWQNFTRTGIEIGPLSNPKIASAAQMVNSSFYYIRSAINDKIPYGISPGGLCSNAYNGHVFWDQETWVYPTFLALQPTLAKSLLAYRVARIEAARQNAQSLGFQGLMYPWESALTGAEVIVNPEHNIEGRYEQHIGGDIAVAIWQYHIASGDTEFLSHVFPLLKGVADFWVGRAVLNPNTQLYEIYNVQPPDESAHVVNNSAYTNAVADLAIRYAIRVASQLGERVDPAWQALNGSFYIPFDAERNIHLEYDGYTNETINQADVALLQYPLNIVYPYELALSDLNFYEDHTDKNGFFTGDSAYSIAYLRLDPPNTDRASGQFLKAFRHQEPPFNIWKEREFTGGNMNFLTGAGGFLQNIVYGYFGIRYHDSGKMEVNPIPMPLDTPADPTQRATLRGLNLRGIEMTIAHDSETVDITIQTPGRQLELTLVNDKRTIVVNTTYSYPLQRAYLQPRTLIKYSDPHDGQPSKGVSTLAIVLASIGLVGVIGVAVGIYVMRRLPGTAPPESFHALQDDSVPTPSHAPDIPTDSDIQPEDISDNRQGEGDQFVGETAA